MEEDLLVKIREEVRRSGFPVELEVASHLSSLGWLCFHSRYYIDKDESKGREIDILAFKVLKAEVTPEDKIRSVQLNVVVECKKSQAPWVVLSRPKEVLDGMYVPTKPDITDDLLKRMRFAATFFKMAQAYSTSTHPRIGVSAFEATRLSDSRGGATGSEKNRAFEALMAVTKALRHEMNNKNSSDEISIFLPIVIFDGHLFEAWLENGQSEVAAVNVIPVEMQYHSPAYTREPNFMIYIIRKDSFKEFFEEKVADLELVAADLWNIFSKEALR